MSPIRTALLLGATGLIGGELLTQLLEDPAYSRISALVRRPLGLAHPKLEALPVDFDALDQRPDLFAVDDIYVALGTTQRKTPDRAQYGKIDVAYPLTAARLGQQQGAQHYLIVTAMGADPRSSIFYNRLKGEVEEGVKSVGLPSVSIFRPSLLLGERREQRLAERIAANLATPLSLLMVGPLRPYRPIHAAVVARAMVRTALTGPTGVHLYPSDRIADVGA